MVFDHLLQLFCTTWRLIVLNCYFHAYMMGIRFLATYVLSSIILLAVIRLGDKVFLKPGGHHAAWQDGVENFRCDGWNWIEILLEIRLMRVSCHHLLFLVYLDHLNLRAILFCRVLDVK